MSTPKMKGLLKGLRYISHMFENEKEPEMQIGLPTDVKHVAHIGCDGPSVNSSPSWMNDFKHKTGSASAPIHSNGNPNGNPNGNDSEVDCVSQGNKSRSTHEKDLPGLPKSTKRNTSAGDCHSKEKSDKPRQSRRSSKCKDSSADGNKATSESMDTMQGNDMPDVPKKARRKRSKESSKQRSKSVETDQSEHSDTETASLT